MSKKHNITVIGTGNGGQAIAGYCAMRGHHVCIYGRNTDVVKMIQDSKKITLCGQIEGEGEMSIVTSNIKIAMEHADIIMIATTANAHKGLAEQMVPHLKRDQIVLLNPGRTGGLLEFKNALNDTSVRNTIYLAEAQTLMYACRIIENAHVNIIGIKNRVLLSSDKSASTRYIINELSDIYPCFMPAKNILQTSFENIGAVFHPSIILFNAATIERGESFYFYRDLTRCITDFINKVDSERISLGKAFGVELIPAAEWVSYAYSGVLGATLHERIKNNPAYCDILSPKSIYSRQLLEDIPTGIVPFLEFAKIAKVEMPITQSVLDICSALLNMDFIQEGRTLKRLGLDKLSVEEIVKQLGC
ncbi:MAG: NAD/NADP octopine/nopaline dehydrogenase family protein [Prevotella sp.]|jgi:opine dehydrogenase|nr:NAD/NADP octopine/nopaline dehydrogenase family protein [Prevotella sp.]